MARTKETARKCPRREAAATEEEEGEEDDDEDDGLDDWVDHDLLVEAVREQRRLRKAIEAGDAGKHVIKRIENSGSCGIGECKVPGARMACVTCRVRLCRNTDCLNAHINELKGRVVSDKLELKVSDDQGKKKEIPGRAQMDEDE